MSLSTITIRKAPGHRARGRFNWAGRSFDCALGRSGLSAFKREGDGATPIAAMTVMGGYVRGDRERSRAAGIPLVAIRADDGWCDAPGNANYNRPVHLPFKASHERMMRDDGLYDICIVLDWNIRRRTRNRGSAIFFHMAKPGFLPTEGCIAVAPPLMRRLLPYLRRGMVIRVLR